MRISFRAKFIHCGVSAAATLASGCILINYDEVPSSQGDGGWTGPDNGGLDAEVAVSDASVDTSLAQDSSVDAAHAPVDATSECAADAALDARSVADARTDTASDAGTHADADAGYDSGTCVANACGGCSTLAILPNTACGSCGGGRYACAGLEATMCMNSAAPAVSSGGTFLIDDFEDGDRYLLSNGNLSGAWYSANDGTGGTISPASGEVPVPIMVGANGSKRSLHLTGGGFNTWGGAIAVSLNAHGCTYNAAAQRGIAFYARGSGTMSVSFATKPTLPSAENGTCTGNCRDFHRKIVTLTSNWSPYTVPYTSLTQAGWGAAVQFKPDQLVYLQWGFGPNTNLDLYLDTVSFY